VFLLGGVVSAVMALAGSGNAAATFATTATIAFALVIPAVWGGPLGARLFLVLGLAQLAFAGTRFAAGLGIGLAGGDAAAVMAGVAAATAVTLGLIFPAAAQSSGTPPSGRAAGAWRRCPTPPRPPA
jgi:hypothetical protein